MRNSILPLALVAGLCLLGTLFRAPWQRPAAASGLTPPARDQARAGPRGPDELPAPPSRPEDAPPGEVEPAGTDEPDPHPTTRQLALEEGIVIEGRVFEFLELGRSEPNRPAPGRIVQLIPRPSSDSPLETVTRSDGSFRFVLPDPGRRPFRYRVQVEADEMYRRVRRARVLRHGESRPDPEQLDRVLHGAPHGVVRDVEGREMAGVEILYQHPEEARRVLSNLDGTFELTDCVRWKVTGALAEGFLLDQEKAARRSMRGGWSMGELTMKVAGSLRVQVVEASGKPIEGAAVWVKAGDKWFHPPSRVRTDDEGLVELKAVPSGETLGVGVGVGDLEEFARRQRNGELLFGEEQPGAPIIARGGGVTEVRARMAKTLRIRGHVRGIEGGSGRARVHAASSRDPDALSCWFAGDDRFELILPSELHDTSLIVSVNAENSAGEPRLARQVVDPSLAREGCIDLVLQASPPLSIRGRITGSEATGVDLWAVPAGSPRPLSSIREGQLGLDEAGLFREKRDLLSVAGDAEFLLGELAPGSYDLVARFHTTGWLRELRVLPGIPAGSRGVVIDCSSEKAVALTLTPDDKTIELASVEVQLARLFPVHPGSIPTPPARIEDPFAFPLGLRGSSSNEAHADSGGYWISSNFKRVAGNPFELPRAEAGCYAIGVRGRLASGERFAAVGSSAMRLGPGEHTLRFAVLPTGSLSIDCSAIRGTDQVLRLGDPGRGFLPLSSGNGPLGFSRSLKDKKNVRLLAIPAGTYEIWAGSPDELDLGSPTCRVPVEILDGKKARAKIGE